MGQNGLGAAQQHHEVRQGGKADHCQHYAKGQRRKKAGGSKAGGSVNDGHQAGNDAHRAGSTGGDAPHKKGIGQIVDAGNQHT